MEKISLFFISLLFIISGCNGDSSLRIADSPDVMAHNWNNATVYFLLTDRFYNSDNGNDINFGRNMPTAVNRGFQGGDLAGITEKIEEGYFTELGVTAIWMTPFFEQIHGVVDEGTGETYGYHGYWAKDWTAIDPNFGTEDDLALLVKTAHEHGIRIVMDVVVNHTGPVTPLDPVWPEEWVRTEPSCTYENYLSTTMCTLVDNLPDIRTESEQDVLLPPALLEKWEREGRLDQELAELETFFNETGYPRAPKYYIIKWLADYVKKFGINGYRLDTAKHTEESVWGVLRKEADKAYAQWKYENPGVFPENDPFYMVGEVYGYGISGGRSYNFGDTAVDYYAEGIDHLLNFELKYHAKDHYESWFSVYSSILNGELEGKGVLNYLASHDDGGPFDKMREDPFRAATSLLLSPGAAQIYYGDETSRILFAEGANGDANLRSFMNWGLLMENALISGFYVKDVLNHYQKLGQFRKNHPAIGAGRHEMLSESPYVFKRTYEADNLQDIVIVGLDMNKGLKSIAVGDLFKNGTRLIDAYSGVQTKVKNGVATVQSDYDIVLLGKF